MLYPTPAPTLSQHGLPVNAGHRSRTAVKYEYDTSFCIPCNSTQRRFGEQSHCSVGSCCCISSFFCHCHTHRNQGTDFRHAAAWLPSLPTAPGTSSGAQYIIHQGVNRDVQYFATYTAVDLLLVNMAARAAVFRTPAPVVRSRCPIASKPVLDCNVTLRRDTAVRAEAEPAPMSEGESELELEVDEVQEQRALREDKRQAQRSFQDRGGERGGRDQKKDEWEDKIVQARDKPHKLLLHVQPHVPQR